MYINLITNYLSRDIAPYVDDKRCLNYHKQNRCHRCVDICPAKAISADGKIFIYEKTCNGCGICTSTCPTRCLTLPGIDWPALYKSAKKLNPIQLGCLKSRSPQTNLTVPCIGSLPAEFIAALAIPGNKLIHIDLEFCLKCENRQALKQLYRTLRKSQDFASIKMKFKVTATQTQSSGNQNLLNQANLLVLKRNFAQVFNSAIDNTFGEDINPSGNNVEGINQKLLKDMLNDYPGLSIQRFSLSVGASCNGCGLCRGSCPGGALDFKYTNNQLNILHDSLKCTSCKLCVKVCPKKALKKTTITLQNRSENCRVIHSLKTMNCTVCNQPFTYSDEQSTLCLKCNKRNQLKESLINKPEKVCRV